MITGWLTWCHFGALWLTERRWKAWWLRVQCDCESGNWMRAIGLGSYMCSLIDSGTTECFVTAECSVFKISMIWSRMSTQWLKERGVNVCELFSSDWLLGNRLGDSEMLVNELMLTVCLHTRRIHWFQWPTKQPKSFDFASYHFRKDDKWAVSPRRICHFWGNVTRWVTFLDLPKSFSKLSWRPSWIVQIFSI